ncbi:MAG: hypothetical protein ACI9DK_003283 [Vicingaceae bacterium]|jgi:hypothetical protein
MRRSEIIEATFIGSALFDANNCMLSVQQCAEFLKVHHKTVTNRILTKNKSKKIFAEPFGKGWKIPKIQFVKEIVCEFEKMKEDGSQDY